MDEQGLWEPRCRPGRSRGGYADHDSGSLGRSRRSSGRMDVKHEYQADHYSIPRGRVRQDDDDRADHVLDQRTILSCIQQSAVYQADHGSLGRNFGRLPVAVGEGSKLPPPPPPPSPTPVQQQPKPEPPPFLPDRALARTSFTSHETAPINSATELAAKAQSRLAGVGRGLMRANDDSRLDEMQSIGRGSPLGPLRGRGSGHGVPITRGRGEPYQPDYLPDTGCYVIDPNKPDKTFHFPSDMPSKLGGMASIDGLHYNGHPVYTVQDVRMDRLILRSIGVPHHEITVLYNNSCFNDIKMREFALGSTIGDVLTSGDQVVVENIFSWYDPKKTGNLTWRSTAIGFPRYAISKLPLHSRWITHGWLAVKEAGGGSYLIDTGVKPEPETKESIKILALSDSFRGYAPQRELESTVVTRAQLAERSEDAWTEKACSVETPWIADTVAVVAGVRESDGCLARRTIVYPEQGGGTRTERTTTICSQGFGYVYVPDEIIPSDVARATDRTWLQFKAVVNRPRNGYDHVPHIKNLELFRWRAITVNISPNQPGTSTWGRMQWDVPCMRCKQKLFCTC